jgi:hypothetical protein
MESNTLLTDVEVKPGTNIPEGGLMLTGKPIGGVKVTNHDIAHVLLHPTENGAEEQAKAEVVRIFDEETYEREIAPLKNADGTFRMFDDAPTLPRLVWVAVLHGWVNGMNVRVSALLKTDQEVEDLKASLALSEAMQGARNGLRSRRANKKSAEEIN